MNDIAPREAGAQADALTVRLTVPGMGSDHCAGIIAGSIRRLPGIGEVGTNIANHRVTVRFDAAAADAAAIRDAVERAGYEVDSIDTAGDTSPAAGGDSEER